MTKLFPFRSRSTVNLGLHSGAASGNLGLVKFALDNGQAIDSVVNGLLPIHAACAGGHTLVAKYLIERGADVNARRYFTPLLITYLSGVPGVCLAAC